MGANFAEAARAVMSASCPVLALAPLLRHVRRDQTRIDEALVLGARSGANVAALEECQKHLCDREDALRQMIAASAATSLQGAAMQLVELFGRIENIGIDGGKLDIEDADGWEWDRECRRLLFSILAVVDGASPQPLGVLIDESYATWRLDPWMEVDSRLAASGAGPRDAGGRESVT